MSELKPCCMTAEEAIKILGSVTFISSEMVSTPGDTRDIEALRMAIEALRRAQPAEPLTTCGECANYQTQNCAAKHEQALMDFCSHGIRKPGGETDDDSYKYKACGRVI